MKETPLEQDEMNCPLLARLKIRNSNQLSGSYICTDLCPLRTTNCIYDIDEKDLKECTKILKDEYDKVKILWKQYREKENEK